MTDSPGPPPSDGVVNDRFWLALAGTQIERSLDTKSRTGSMLLSAVSWFWTVYTGSVLLGVAIADTTLSTWQAVVVASPVVILSAAYLIGLWAAQPIMSEFDPRDPAAVQHAFEAGVRTAARRLRLASVGLGAGALAVSAAVVVLAIGA